MKFEKFKQRGQVLVFYALIIPLLLLLVGAGLDLGWYYLNVSRLQNAADAAALAGARALVAEDRDFNNYYVATKKCATNLKKIIIKEVIMRWAL